MTELVWHVLVDSDHRQGDNEILRIDERVISQARQMPYYPNFIGRVKIAQKHIQTTNSRHEKHMKKHNQ